MYDKIHYNKKNNNNSKKSKKKISDLLKKKKELKISIEYQASALNLYAVG